MQKILVIMPNWFGETLFVTPLLRALHEARPDVSIIGMGVPRSLEVLRGNPCLSETMVYDEDGAHQRVAAKLALLPALRGFDVAVITRRSLSRTLLLALARVRQRIGFDNPKSGWLLTHRLALPEPGLHKARGLLRLLQPLGIHRTDGPCEYFPTDDERAWAIGWLAHSGLGAPPVVVHPGANWEHKRWPAERFAQLIDRLRAERSVPVLLTGGPDDNALIQQILKKTEQPPKVLMGDTTLRQLAACLERSRLVITNDTGPAHLAAALQRPLIALFGPTLPWYTGPLGDPARLRVLHHPDCCPSLPCLNPDHPTHPGMASISVDEVFSAASELLDSV